MLAQPRHTLAVFVSFSLAAPSTSLAQDAEQGGTQVNLNYTERLQYTDDEGTELNSGLQLDISSQTRTQRLAFSLFGTLEKSLSNGLGSARVENPRAAFEYGIETRNTELSFDTVYRRTEIDSLSLEDATAQNTTTLDIDTGDREDISTGFVLDIARAAPFGATVSLNHTETSFINTVSDTLIDSKTTSGSVRLRLNLAPTYTGFVTASTRKLDRNGGIDTTTNAFQISSEIDINPSLRGVFGLGYTTVRSSGSAVPNTTDGLSYSARLITSRPNGTLDASMTSAIQETGRRSSLRLNRSFDLPRGSLSGGIGLSHNSQTNGTDPLYDLSYSRTFSQAKLRATFRQAFATNSVGTEALNSFFDISLSRNLSEISVLTTRFSVSDSNQNGGGTDSSRIDFRVDYSRSLTPDWSLVSGFSHVRRRQSGSDDSTDNEVYLGLRTTVGWRP